MGIRTLPLRGQATHDRSEWAGAMRLRDRFELLVPIGSGGFGTVWEGFDMLLERPVAIKELPLEDTVDAGGDALREARATARLNHPTIVSLYEIVAEPDRIFMVNELVRGCTLSELVDEALVSDHDIARIGYALCEALSHAHAHGVIHRDVKPANVMITDEWMDGVSGWRTQPAKLMDFGIASVVDHGERGHGPHAGTLEYMAPEQVAGRAATPATDVYSLALVLYECFTGAVAGNGRRSSIERSRPDLPPGLTDVIERCLNDEPELRPGVDDLASALSVALPVLSDQIPDTGLWRRFRGRLGDRAPRSKTATNGAATPSGRGERLVRRLPAALAAALVALATVASTGLALTAWPPLAAALAVLMLPRAGWPLAAALAAAALAATGQPGSGVLLAIAFAPSALLLAGPWSAAVRGIVAASLAGVTAFAWTTAVQLIAGEEMVVALPSGIGVAADRRESIGAAVDAAVACALPAYAALVALWAASGAATVLLFRRRLSPAAWFVAGAAAIAAHVLIAEALDFPVPLVVLAAAPLALVSCTLTAEAARRIGRVFAVSGGPVSQHQA